MWSLSCKTEKRAISSSVSSHRRLLTGYKSKTFAKLKQELFQIINYGLLQLCFSERGVSSETEKFTNNGIFNKLHRVWRLQRSCELQHLFLNKIFALRGKQTVVILRTDITLESAHTRILRGSFGFIPLPGFIIKLLGKGEVMSPRQKV